MVLSQRASLAAGRPSHPCTYLHGLLCSICWFACPALAPSNTWALLCRLSGPQQTWGLPAAQPYAWLYLQGQQWVPWDLFRSLGSFMARQTGLFGNWGCLQYICTLATSQLLPLRTLTPVLTTDAAVGGSIATQIITWALLISSGPCLVFLISLLRFFKGRFICNVVISRHWD